MADLCTVGNNIYLTDMKLKHCFGTKDSNRAIAKCVWDLCVFQLNSNLFFFKHGSVCKNKTKPKI